jgi:hypothetical protein
MLEAIRLGARWVTSREALARWAERLTPLFDIDPEQEPRTPNQRTKAAARAAEILTKAGI